MQYNLLFQPIQPDVLLKQRKIVIVRLKGDNSAGISETQRGCNCIQSYVRSHINEGISHAQFGHEGPPDVQLIFFRNVTRSRTNKNAVRPINNALQPILSEM